MSPACLVLLEMCNAVSAEGGASVEESIAKAFNSVPFLQGLAHSPTSIVSPFVCNLSIHWLQD